MIPSSTKTTVAMAKSPFKRAFAFNFRLNYKNSDDDDNEKNKLSHQNIQKKANVRVLKSTPIKNVIQIESLNEFESYMESIQNQQLLVVVRFYATWCKTCRKTEPFFFRFARRNPNITFLNIPFTQTNSNLHQALNVSSVPFGHIYHSTQLVEEMKMNNWSMFEETVKHYATSEIPKQ
jgi:thiol-disulfide isomerase/thioredoxin